MTPFPVDADLDANAAARLQRAHSGGHALKHVLTQQYPTLGPSHSDVAVTEDEVNYGVSAGDETHPSPCAYVGPWRKHTGPFWNAPLDALTAEIVDFFERARSTGYSSVGWEHTADHQR